MYKKNPYIQCPEEQEKKNTEKANWTAIELKDSLICSIFISTLQVIQGLLSLLQSISRDTEKKLTKR